MFAVDDCNDLFTVYSRSGKLCISVRDDVDACDLVIGDELSLLGKQFDMEGEVCVLEKLGLFLPFLRYVLRVNFRVSHKVENGTVLCNSKIIVERDLKVRYLQSREL